MTFLTRLVLLALFGTTSVALGQVNLSDAKAVQAKAEKIIVPRVEFREATLGEALAYARKKLVDLDEAKTGEKGINIVLAKLPADTAARIENAKITLSLNNIPFSEFLRYTADQVGLKVHAVPYALVFEDARANDSVPLFPQPNSGSAEAAYLDRAMKLIIPKLEFRDAIVREGMDYLRKKSVDLNPGGQPLNLILKETPESADARVTLSLTNVPLPVALGFVAQLGGLGMQVNAGWIYLHPPDENLTTARPLGPEPAPGTPEAAYLARAMKLTLPKLEFREATLDEGVEYLRKKSAELDPAGKPLNIIVKGTPASAEAKVTMSLTNVPLPVALGFVAQLSGLRMKVNAGAFYLHPPE